QHNEAVALGKRLLIRELQAHEHSYEDIDPAQLKKVLEEYHLKSEEDLLHEVGLGNRMAPIIAHQLLGEWAVHHPHKGGNGADAEPLLIRGSEGMVVNFPKCCRPVPGDPILGFVTAGR